MKYTKLLFVAVLLAVLTTATVVSASAHQFVSYPVLVQIASRSDFTGNWASVPFDPTGSQLYKPDGSAQGIYVLQTGLDTIIVLWDTAALTVTPSSGGNWSVSGGFPEVYEFNPKESDLVVKGLAFVNGLAANCIMTLRIDENQAKVAWACPR